MRPTFRQLQYLVALADTRRFGAAAERCHVSQPALSSQIAALEADLGAVLVERRNSGIVLTPRGRETVRRARHVLLSVQDIRDAVRSIKDQLSGHLRLGVLPSVGAYFLPHAATQLHQRYPDLRLHVHEGDTQSLIRDLNKGVFDCILSTPTNVEAIASSFLFAETLWVCAAPEDEISQSSEPLPLSGLRGKTLICLDDRFQLAEICNEIAALAGATISADYRGSSLDAVRQMALMGSGVAVLPSLYALGEALRSSDVRVRRIAHKAAVHPIVLAWRETSPLGPAMEALAEQMILIKALIPDVQRNIALRS